MAMEHADENPKRIVLIRTSGRAEENKANAAGILPGQLLELKTNGNVGVHSTASGHAQRRFAVEDSLQGRKIADAYDDGDIVIQHLAVRGEVVYARVEGGANYTRGALLVSAGNGDLQIRPGTPVDPDDVVAVVRNPLDLSGESAARVAVEVL